MNTAPKPHNYDMEKLCTEGFRHTNKALLILGKLNEQEEVKRKRKEDIVLFRRQVA